MSKHFLITSLLSVALAGSLVGCNQQPAADQQTAENTSAQSPAIKPVNKLVEITENESIVQLHQRLIDKEFSVTELTQFYLDRIAQENSKYNAVIMTNPKALEIAKQLDAELAAGNNRGLLHGIPILLKDNIETIEMPTTAGSVVLKNNITNRDATITSNLRKAGAVILGKANLSEWANFRSERSSSGWSAIGGQTKNPHDVSRTTCGSSSGSGAAVAANLAVAAIGTETNGSITCPSAMNGVVGIKPTVGLASRFGIVPISHTQDTAGPMTKHVIDASIILQAMSSQDSNDSRTSDETIKRFTYYPDTADFTLANAKKVLSATKIGLMESSATRHEQVKAIEERLVSALKADQVTVTDKLKHSPYKAFYGDTYDVLLYEFKHDLNEYFAGLPNEFNTLTLEQAIEINKQQADVEMPYFQQEIFIKSQEKDDISSEDYQTKLANIRKATRDDGIDKVFKEQSVDVLIAISRGPAWKIDKINGDSGTGGVSTFSAVSGYPHITIPLGKLHGLPIGISLMGQAGDDQKLIELALYLEAYIKGTLN
ncbi:MAG: amidase [Kangiellaceae bacterium]|jgi:amidase|nr:amidase [Kangiellaceae bacterium]